MKLVASLITRNEMERYLPLVIENLSDFCDEIRVLDDFSSDGTYEFLLSQEKVRVLTNPGPPWIEHEGRARNQLLGWTLQGAPTHVLAIDADELVSDGYVLRDTVVQDERCPLWTLLMEEIWKADDRFLYVRQDGGWKEHPVPILWRVEGSSYRIMDRALACGREPEEVRRHHRKARATGVSVLHFGWTDERSRLSRYQRYAVADGGKFHASRHLDSIMWTDERVNLSMRPWPGNLPKDEILRASGYAVVE